MNRFYTFVSAAALLFSGMTALAENPYAPTGEETVTGQIQILSNVKKVKQNVLSGAAELGTGADGWSMQCMNLEKNLESGSSISVSGSSYVSIKLSNGAQNTVTLPEGKVANAVTIYSVINKDAATDRPCYFKEVDGVNYPAPETDNLTSFKDFSNPDVSYFKLNGGNTFTFTNAGEQVFVVLAVDYSDEPKVSFGDVELAAPVSVWPVNGNTMLPTAGELRLTYEAPVQVAGKATIGGKEFALAVDGNVVTIPYEGLDALTEVTVTIPAGVIGTEEAANTEMTYTFTTAPANELFYTDFKVYPYAYYEQFGDLKENYNIIANNSTDVTVEVGGMTFYSGTKGRVVALSGPNNAASTESDYGPYTDADAGASNYCVQLIAGGNQQYFETPEFEGPAEVTFYLANPDAKAVIKAQLTDDRGKDYTLAEFEMAKAKRVFKFTYTYPYKGAAKLRLYNNGNKININDVLVVKSDIEGEERPVDTDTEAPVVLRSWPSDAPYAQPQGQVTVVYNEPVVAPTAKATLNTGEEFDVTVEGSTLEVIYYGLEHGKEYTMTIPAVADEAGNATEPMTVKINTISSDIYYYTDFNYFPFGYWNKFCTIPNDAADNEDIIARNSTDVTVAIAGVTYYSGTAGRVVAMGKPNLIAEGDEGASQRCVQVIGGGNGLYLQFPEMSGATDLTIYIGNSSAKEGNLVLTDGTGNTDAPLATFPLTAEKKMFKFNYNYTGTGDVTFRLYNMGIQCNVHDVILAKGQGTSGVADIAVETEDAAPVYYNLQGMKVENPTNGLYIRVRGNVVDKVAIK